MLQKFAACNSKACIQVIIYTIGDTVNTMHPTIENIMIYNYMTVTHLSCNKVFLRYQPSMIVILINLRLTLTAG